MRHTPNSKPIPIDVVGSSTFGIFPKISAALSQNLFISDEFLISFPGYQKVVQLLEQGGQGRGLFRSFRSNIMVAVVNSIVYRIDANLNATVIGNLETQFGEVSIDENLSNQICIVDGLNAYIYNTTEPANLTIQTGGPLSGTPPALIPNYVAFHNTYFLFGNALQGTTGSAWFAYEYASATTISPVQINGVDAFFSITTKPDYAVAVQRIPGQSNNVLVFGTSVCEVHTNVSDTQIYRKNSSISVDYGCLSVSTISSSDNYIVWLGVNETNAPAIMIYTTSGAESISTDGIDHIMGLIQYPAQSTAMFTWKEGHLFYILTFFNPADNLTLAYDFTEKKFLNLTDGDNNYFPARQMVYFNQESYFININNGCIYNFDTELTVYNDNIPNSPNLLPSEKVPDDPRLIQTIPRVRITSTVRAPDTAPFRANSFTFTMDMGNDNIPAQQDCITLLIAEDGTRIFSENGIQLVPEGGGSDDCPSYQYQGAIDMAFSKNGGETWSNYVRKYTNLVGVRQNILRWQNMGKCNEFTIKLKFWTWGRVVIYNGVLEIF